MVKLTLYDISDELESLFARQSEALTSEERASVEAEIDELEVHKDVKINSLVAHIKSLIALETALDNEIGQLKTKKDTVRTKISWLKHYLTVFSGGYIPKSCTVPFHWQKRKQVKILDEDSLPEWVYTTPEPTTPPPRLSLKKIEEAWKEGNEIPGTAYEEVFIPVFPTKSKMEANDEQ